MGFLAKFFDNTAREIDKYRKVVTQINALEPTIEKLSNDQLRAKTEELRQRVQTAYRKQRSAVEASWASLTDAQRRDEDRKIYDPILDSVLPEALPLYAKHRAERLGYVTTMFR